MTNRMMRIGEMKKREADGKIYLEGYFARFNEPYEVWDGWVETVAPGAFSNVLSDPDTKALWNHNRDIVLGSTSAGTLVLRQDEFGLYGSIEINQSDTDAMNAYSRVERGDVSGCSFGFDCRTTDNVTEDGVFHSVIVEVTKLYEVSPCTFPAYESTSIQAREAMDAMDARKKLAREKWRADMKERLHHGT